MSIVHGQTAAWMDQDASATIGREVGSDRPLQATLDRELASPTEAAQQPLLVLRLTNAGKACVPINSGHGYA